MSHELVRKNIYSIEFVINTLGGKKAGYGDRNVRVAILNGRGAEEASLSVIFELKDLKALKE